MLILSFSVSSAAFTTREKDLETLSCCIDAADGSLITGSVLFRLDTMAIPVIATAQAAAAEINFMIVCDFLGITTSSFLFFSACSAACTAFSTDDSGALISDSFLVYSFFFIRQFLLCQDFFQLFSCPLQLGADGVDAFFQRIGNFLQREALVVI